MKQIRPVPIILLLSTTLGGGCYTILRHPIPPPDQRDESAEARACSDCHADADLYHFTDPTSGGWYLSYPLPWAAYYETPWWYGNYWYYPPDGPRDPGPPPETGGRTLWGRGGHDFLPPQGDQIQDRDGKPTLPGGSDDKPDDKPQRDQEKEKKKRRLWGR